MQGQPFGVLEEKSVMLMLLDMVVVLLIIHTEDDPMLDQLYGVSEERSVMPKLMLSVMVVVLPIIPMVDAHMLDQPYGVLEERSVKLMAKLLADTDTATTLCLATPSFPDLELATIQVVINIQPVVSVPLDGDMVTMLCQDIPLSTDLNPRQPRRGMPPPASRPGL